MPLRLPKVRSDLEFFDQEVEGEEVVVVRDPVRGTYFKYNPLQAAMLRKLDGIRSIDEMVASLSDEYNVEIPREAAERFVAHARKQMLLDVASYNVPEEKAQKAVLKALKKRGFQFRGVGNNRGEGLSQRVVSAEAVLFMGGIRHLQGGHPAKALDYFNAVLELNPKNQRAQTLVDTIQTAYVKALSGSTTDWPTFATFNPTRILNVLDRTVGKIAFHWVGLLLVLALVAAAAHAYSITTPSEIHVGPIDILLVYVLMSILNFGHELAHGLACQHFGGRVTEIGFTQFYYLLPFAYCDTSSSYLFRNRGHKLAVQLAGNVFSVIFLCLVLIVGSLLHDDVFIYPAGQVIAYITLATLGGNLVPFLKLDGYYALCDILGTPNLRERSFKLLKTWLGKRLFGIPGPEEALDPRKRQVFFTFAALSTFWTLSWIYQAVFMLTAPVVERWQGTGLVLSVLILGYLLRRTLVRPVIALGKLLVRERARILTLRRGSVLLLLLALLIAPWMLQWPVLVDSDFVLVPKERREVRAEVAGDVDRVLVREGQAVKRGEPIGILRNQELELEYEVVQAELAAIDAHVAQLKSGARVEEIQLAKTQVRTAVAAQLRETRQATVAARLADTGLGTHARADSTAGSAEVSQSLANAARWRLATLQAGSREEAIAAVEAERTRLSAQLDRVNGDRARLTIRSPIDGVVISKHMDDRLYMHLERGATFAEIHDVSSFVAEIHLPASSPLDELELGDEIEMRAEGASTAEVTCRIDRIRDIAENGDERKTKDPNAKDLIVVTTPFALPVGRSGMSGHARLYGRERSLAYAKLYLPLQRLVRVSLWALM